MYVLPYLTLSSPPCNFGKILVVGYFIEQNFILKILVLEIILRKISLIFLFIRYDTTIIQLLFWKNFLISLLLQALNEIIQSNIFLVFFFYTRSFKVNSIYIISGSDFCLTDSRSIGLFSYSSIS